MTEVRGVGRGSGRPNSSSSGRGRGNGPRSSRCRNPTGDFSSRLEALGGLGVDQETGKNTVHIITNHFKINCNGSRVGKQVRGATGPKEFTVYQYDVKFEDNEASFWTKKNMLNACREAIFQGAYLFDAGNQLYCTNLFTQDVIQLSLAQNDESGHVSPEKQEKVGLTLTYTKSLSQDDPICLQIYNLVIKQCMYGLGLDPLGDNFYDSSKEIDYPKLKLKIWPGYVASLKPCEKGLLLEVDMVHKVIHSEDLLTAMKELKDKHGKRQFNKSVEEFIEDELKGIVVLTPYNKNSYKIDGVRTDMTPMTTFPLKDGTIISYYDYYKKKYNIEIQDKNQPLIVSHVKERLKRKIEDEKSGRKINEVILIPELLTMTGLSDEIRNNFVIMKDLGKHIHLGPAERMEKIKEFMKRVMSSSEVQESLSNWGLSFDQSIMPCITGEVLAKEAIIFANEKTYLADENSDWTRGLRGNQMLVSVPLKEWIVITGERHVKLATDFVETMRKVALPLGFRIAPPLAIEKIKDVRAVNYIRRLEQLTSTAYKHVQMVVCVLPNNGSELYNGIKKRLTKDIGIPSQCIIAKTLTKNLMSVSTKVVIQMNAKLGGEPWKVKLPQELEKDVMAIGFDYNYIGRGVKTGVVVSTINQELTRYYSISFQFKEQEEMNEALATAIRDSIEFYCKAQKTAIPPSCVLLYRNNVDEGRITSGEIENDANNLQKDLDKWYMERFADHGVKLVYITMAKRSNTRLMSHAGTCDEGSEVRSEKILNAPPGTVVDKDIVSMNKEVKEFFMVSTLARHGSARTIHYRVILDKKGISSTDIEAFTYKLCHLYYNWTGTVSLPSVCQYAGKLAKLTTQALPGCNANQKIVTLLHYL